MFKHTQIALLAGRVNQRGGGDMIRLIYDGISLEESNLGLHTLELHTTHFLDGEHVTSQKSKALSGAVP